MLYLYYTIQIATTISIPIRASKSSAIKSNQIIFIVNIKCQSEHSITKYITR